VVWGGLRRDSFQTGGKRGKKQEDWRISGERKEKCESNRGRGLVLPWRKGRYAFSSRAHRKKETKWVPKVGLMPQEAAESCEYGGVKGRRIYCRDD